jgi:hypothetical protein
MVDTPRTRAQILSDFADNTSGNILPQTARNAWVTMLGPVVTLTPVSGAVTWPLATAPIATVTLVANTTITVTGGEDGMTGYRLAIIQGGVGSFVPTLSGVTLSSTPTWNTTAGTSNRVYIDCVVATLMADVI